MPTDLPVGSIVYSILDEATFRMQMGNREDWVLADGRSIAGQNKLFERVTGSAHIPNLCGVFVRGKNNGRADGFQNPDGDLVLGHSSQDKFREHSHGAQTGDDSPDHVHGFGGYPYGVEYGNDNGAQNLGVSVNGFYRNTDGANVRHKHSISAEGGNETSPKSITLNPFIRID